MEPKPNNMKKITCRQTQNLNRDNRFKVRGPRAGDITGHDPHIVIRSRTKSKTSKYSKTTSSKIREGRAIASDAYVGSRRKDG